MKHLSLNVAGIKFHRSILKPQAPNEIMLSFKVWPIAKFSNIKLSTTNNFTNSQRVLHFLEETTADYCCVDMRQCNFDKLVLGVDDNNGVT